MKLHPELELLRRRCLSSINTFYVRIVKRSTHPSHKIQFADVIFSTIMYDLHSDDPVIPTLVNAKIIKETVEVDNKISRGNIRKLNTQLRSALKLIHTLAHGTLSEYRITKDHIRKQIVLKYKDIPCSLPAKLYTKMMGDLDPSVSKAMGDKLIWMLVYRYTTVGSYGDNMNLSLRPDLIRGVELFGSAFNHHTERFCSIFPDLEAPFGSMGNYFTHVPPPGTTLFINPPYINLIMENAVRRALRWLDMPGSELTAIFVIPVWDDKTRIKFGLKPYGAGYKTLDLLKYSHLVQNVEVFRKGDLPFYDYFKDRIVYPSPIYRITMANRRDTPRRFYVGKSK